MAQIDFDTHNQAIAYPLETPAEVARSTSVRAPALSCDALAPAPQLDRLHPVRQGVEKDPLAGAQSGAPSVPISDAIFNGASAAYYAALFAYDAVKSMGSVQSAFNDQEVASFNSLETAWDNFASADADFIQKQGQTSLYSGIASGAIGVGGSLAVVGWGIGQPKGWFGGEDIEGEINAHFAQNPNNSELTATRLGPQTNDIEEQENIGPSSNQLQDRIELEAQDDDENEPSNELTQTEKKAEKRIEWLQEKLKSHTNTFQSYAGLVQGMSSTGQSVGQGVGQMQSAGVREHADQEDKTKQLTQQVFNVEDAGWSSAVQTLKEMTSTAARSINELAAAEQRA